MLFNSIEYLLFLPIIFFLFYAAPPNKRWVLLLTASYVFYMSWNPVYALLMLFTTFVTYVAGWQISRSEGQGLRKFWLGVGFTIPLAVLFFFKYFGFFDQTLREIIGFFGLHYRPTSFSFLLPVGISFYTFESLSYCVDVYRGRIPVEKHFGIYALFIVFFPKLIAGPIEKSGDLLPQFRRTQAFDYQNVRSGLLLIGWGLFKKIAVADRLAILVDNVYGSVYHFEGMELLVATIFFSLQIYLDFSAYSEIALGSAQILGFKLTKNFDRPYFSKSVAEFWQRWHITLGRWFRDYMYLPLGGNRCRPIRHSFNLIIVFLASGLWHGASWNFVIWGLLHGIYLVTAIWWSRLIPTREPARHFSARLGQALGTYVLVTFAWIFFRSNNLEESSYVIKSILSVPNFHILLNGRLFELGLDAVDFLVVISLMVFVVSMEFFQRRQSIREWLSQQGPVYRWVTYVGLVMATLLLLTKGEKQMFIYFQF